MWQKEIRGINWHFKRFETTFVKYINDNLISQRFMFLLIISSFERKSLMNCSILFQK